MSSATYDLAQPQAHTQEQTLRRSTNGRSTLALIFALFGLALPAVIFGHIALHEIKRTGDSGHSVAVWATVLGWLELGLTLLFLLLELFVLASLISQIPR